MTKQMTQWEPVEGVTPFGLTFGRMFDEVFGRRPEDGDRLMAPALDVAEDADRLTITAELPGLKKEDVQIQVENGVLAISGEKRADKDEKDRNWHRMERRYGSFYRAITLPRGVNAEAAEATFENGVLTIALPKREDVKPRTLKIK